jgi:putative NADH-flavin reductase
MIITIFGSTGQVGKQVVKQALHNGDTVKAFGRNVFIADFPENESLHLINGALFDEKQVLDAIKGSDAVISVLGGAFDGTDNTRSLGMKNIVAQMQKAGVKRIVALGGMGVLDVSEDDTSKLMESESYPPEYLPVDNEHLKAFQYLSASSLDWTFVCTPDIIEAPETGIIHTAANVLPVPNTDKINSGDLALFMLDELNRNEYVKERVGISN